MKKENPLPPQFLESFFLIKNKIVLTKAHKTNNKNISTIK